MAGAALVVWMTTAVSWAVSLPVVFGLVYRDCFHGCLADACSMVFRCENAWGYAPMLALYGLVVGLVAGLVGFEIGRSRDRERKPTVGPRSRSRAFLGALPFVLLAAPLLLILLPGIELQTAGLALGSACGLVVLVALLARLLPST